jgi:hypothetical protein
LTITYTSSLIITNHLVSELDYTQLLLVSYCTFSFIIDTSFIATVYSTGHPFIRTSFLFGIIHGCSSDSPRLILTNRPLIDHEQHPNGLTGVLGHWAESTIFGGVITIGRCALE